MKEAVKDALSSRHVQLNTAAAATAAVLVTAQENFHYLAPVLSPETYGWSLFALALANVGLSVRKKARKKRELLREVEQ